MTCKFRKFSFAVFLLVPSLTLADMGYWGCDYGPPQVLRSGPLACRQEVRDCYKMTLTCSQGDKTLFKVDDFADAVAMSEDGRYIVGLSNRGSKNAFWIRDRQGKLITWKTHNFSLHYWLGIHYCRYSVTNVREWFAEKQPDVKFQFKDGKLSQVSVRSCDGKEVQLPWYLPW
jgi:hypothetical protein